MKFGRSLTVLYHGDAGRAGELCLQWLNDITRGGRGAWVTKSVAVAHAAVVRQLEHLRVHNYATLDDIVHALETTLVDTAMRSPPRRVRGANMADALCR